MKYNDIKIGEYYKFTWNDDDENKRTDLIFVIGRNPFNGKLVVSCKAWSPGLSHIDDEDLQYMEKI